MSKDVGAGAQDEVADLNLKFDAIDDPRECYRLVQERIKQHLIDGTEAPEDLAILQRQLMSECMAESQGR